MLGSRCCSQIACIAQNGITKVNLYKMMGYLAQRLYSKDKGDRCCESNPQTAGKTVQPWPKPTAVDPPPPMWRCECPQTPQPPNYDPYRIKVPDYLVPPLPPTNAKEIPNVDEREMFTHLQMKPNCNSQSDTYRVQDMFQNSTLVHPDYWKDKPVKKLSEIMKEVIPKLGYHGRSTYKYAFHEPWKPLDRLTLLAEAEKQELEQLKEENLK